MAKVQWIKLSVDMFSNHKIRHLRSLPDGNSIILIWVMLLTIAGRCNAGGMLYLTETVPYTPKLLADELNFSESTVKLALAALQQLGMIELDEDKMLICSWADHQNADGLERIREQNRERKARQRARIASNAAQSESLLSGHVTGHVTVTQSHATEEDKEEDIDKEKEIEIDKEIYSAVVTYLNSVCSTNYRASSKATQRLIHARVSEGYTLEDFKTVIDKKATEWGQDPKMQNFLRPETLFGTKFEGYLNQHGSGKQETANDRMRRLKEEGLI